MTVRAATTADVPGQVALFGQLGYPCSAETLAARIERNSIVDYQAWVFDLDTPPGVIGFAGGHILRPYEDDELAAQLMMLVVDEQHRGHGAGSALVTVFEDWARREGAGRVIVGLGAARTQAHRFYRTQGYEATGVRFGKSL